MKTYKERTEEILKRVEKKRRTRKIVKNTALAAVTLTTALVLFVPYNHQPASLKAYEGSEYYALMKKVSELSYEAPSYKNNFERWFGKIQFGCAAKGYAKVDMMALPSGSEAYEEVTNNQEAGVIEGDLFKRSDRYIYYLKEGISLNEYGKNVKNGFTLYVYSIAGEASEEVKRIEILPEEGTVLWLNQGAEMYLSEDCKTVTVFAPCYDQTEKLLYTTAINVDVSDLENARETSRAYLSGNYVSSRKVGDEFLLVSNFSVKTNADFSSEAEYLPQAGGWQELVSVAAQDIHFNSDAAYARYTVVCKLACDDLAVVDSEAFLSYSTEVYASEENVYLTRSYLEEKTSEDETYKIRTYMTEISCVNYAGEGLEFVSSVAVEGTVIDQYSMDEHEGLLRVFTDHAYWVSGSNTNKEGWQSANLYCLDFDTREIVAKVERFAPEGERLRSARFEGDKGYACTAVELTDPVFAFDLSDLSNITYSDTGTIDGYSLSLVKFKDDTLLGIGVGGTTNSNSNLKIEVYAETQTEVISLAKYEPTVKVRFSTDFKAYYLDVNEGYIGLDTSIGYLLFKYDTGVLNEVVCVPFITNGNYGRTRATIIDGYLYLLNDGAFTVEKI